MEIPYNWIAYICHVGSSHYCSFIVQSGLIAGRKDSKAGRQTVFFTALDPMNEIQTNETYDVKEPRVVPSRTKWKVYQNSVYWINLKSAQGSGLRFQQTNSNAIILDNSVPADCLEKVVNRKSREKFRIKRFVCRHVCHQRFFSRVFGKFDTRARRKSCCRPSDDRTRRRLKISRCST